MAEVYRIASRPNGIIDVYLSPKVSLEFSSLSALRQWCASEPTGFDEADIKRLLDESTKDAKQSSDVVTAKSISFDAKSEIVKVLSKDVVKESVVKNG